MALDRRSADAPPRTNSRKSAIQRISDEEKNRHFSEDGGAASRHSFHKVRLQPHDANLKPLDFAVRSEYGADLITIHGIINGIMINRKEKEPAALAGGGHWPTGLLTNLEWQRRLKITTELPHE